MSTRPCTMLILALLSTSISGQAAETTNECNPVSDDDARATRAFWTEETLRTATPLASPKLSSEQIERLLSLAPNPPADHLPAGEPEVEGEPSRVNVSKSPYNKGGKLYFTQKGIAKFCSAQFVGSTTVLMTAAHCVRDIDGTWVSNVTFRRAYDDGGGQEVYPLRLGTKQGWVSGGENRWRWDYAFIETADASTAGFMGLKSGLPEAQFPAIGYPLNYGDGKYMYSVNGRIGRSAGGVVEMLGNPMRSGNSGGAWLSGNYAIGLNSYHVSGNTTDEWSPWFDNETLKLYGFVENDCNPVD